MKKLMKKGEEGLKVSVVVMIIAVLAFFAFLAVMYLYYTKSGYFMVGMNFR